MKKMQRTSMVWNYFFIENVRCCRWVLA